MSPPSAAPTPRPVPECTDLATHDFSAYAPCGGTPMEGAGDGVPLPYLGPLHVIGEELTAFYVNAVVAWDIASGEPSRVLAPRRANNWLYATDGVTTVVPRCDGALIAHVDGCLTHEMAGHRTVDGGDGILAMAFSQPDLLITLGADNTLRAWTPSTGSAEAMIELEQMTDTRALSIDPEGSILITEGSTLTVVDPTTLGVVEHITGLPPTGGPWLSDGTDLLALGTERREVLRHTPAAGTTSAIPVPHDGQHLALGGGRAAVVDGAIRLISGDGFERLDAYSYTSTGLVLSPDGTYLFAASGTDGLTMVETASGQVVRTFARP